MKKYLVFVNYSGMCRDIAVEAFTPSQAISLAKMQCTSLELASGEFEAIEV